MPHPVIAESARNNADKREKKERKKKKTDLGKGRNYPPQPKQLMPVWGKKRTENRRKNKKKETGRGTHIYIYIYGLSLFAKIHPFFFNSTFPIFSVFPLLLPLHPTPAI